MIDDDRRFARLCSDKLGWHGYGGDEALHYALRSFLLSCTPAQDGGSFMYDYREVSEVIGGAATWMLIYALVRADLIDYGTSPRFGWLTPEGQWLREYVATGKPEELAEIHQADDGYDDVTPPTAAPAAPAPPAAGAGAAAAAGPAAAAARGGAPAAPAARP